MSPALRSLAANLSVADRPFKLPFILGDIIGRMTVVRLADGSLFPGPRAAKTLKSFPPEHFRYNPLHYMV